MYDVWMYECMNVWMYLFEEEGEAEGDDDGAGGVVDGAFVDGGLFDDSGSEVLYIRHLGEDSEIGDYEPLDACAKA